MDPHVLYYILAGLLIMIGLAGTIVPVLPGLPLMFAGMLLAAWVDDFQQIGIPMVIVLGVLALLALVIDFLSTSMGAQRVGASRKAVIGAFVGTVAGLFVLPPLGLLLGPFVGAMGGELLHGREVGQAARVGFATWLGIAFGVVLKLALAFAMLGLFALAWIA
ncbi:MAG: DUF456 domain-containing protein [Gammaproteobacteria bacterium PRO9]|nr:DUF456 domain-containing protein [Gammaproteobacteria bacterium PRO9]